MDNLNTLKLLRNAIYSDKMTFYDSSVESPKEMWDNFHLLEQSDKEALLNSLDLILSDIDYVIYAITSQPFTSLFNTLCSSSICLAAELPGLFLSSRNLDISELYNSISFVKSDSAHAYGDESKTFNGDFYRFNDTLPYLSNRLKVIGAFLKRVIPRFENISKEILEAELQRKGYSSVKEFVNTANLLENAYAKGKLDFILTESFINHIIQEFSDSSSLYDLYYVVSKPLSPFLFIPENARTWERLLGVVPKYYVNKILSDESSLFLKSRNKEYSLKISAGKSGYIDHNNSIIKSFCMWLCYKEFNYKDNFLDRIAASLDACIDNFKKSQALMMENIASKYSLKIDYNAEENIKLIEKLHVSLMRPPLEFFKNHKNMRSSRDSVIRESLFINLQEDIKEFFNKVSNEIIDENNAIDIELFYRMLGKHLVDKYPGKELAMKFPPISSELNTLEDHVNEKLSMSVGSNITKNFLNNLILNKDASKLPIIDNQNVDISGIIDTEDVRSLLMIHKCAYEPYSFIRSKNYIKNKISNMKVKKDLYYSFYEVAKEVKEIPKADFDNFLSKLEELLIRQLSQEDLFLQGKTNSLGLTDNLKDKGISVKNNPVNINYQYLEKDKPLIESFSIDSYLLLHRSATRSDDEVFSMFESFYIQFFNKFEDIIRYFMIFKNEKDQFFKINDLNSMKNSIIKLLN
jgi:hypothetical protein